MSEIETGPVESEIEAGLVKLDGGLNTQNPLEGVASGVVQNTKNVIELNVLPDETIINDSSLSQEMKNHLLNMSRLFSKKCVSTHDFDECVKSMDAIKAELLNDDLSGENDTLRKIRKELARRHDINEVLYQMFFDENNKEKLLAQFAPEIEKVADMKKQYAKELDDSHKGPDIFDTYKPLESILEELVHKPDSSHEKQILSYPAFIEVLRDNKLCSKLKRFEGKMKTLPNGREEAQSVLGVEFIGEKEEITRSLKKIKKFRKPEFGEKVYVNLGSGFYVECYVAFLTENMFGEYSEKDKSGTMSGNLIPIFISKIVSIYDKNTRDRKNLKLELKEEIPSNAFAVIDYRCLTCRGNDEKEFTSRDGKTYKGAKYVGLSKASIVAKFANENVGMQEYRL